MPDIKIAYFILCHKNPEQVIRLLDRLRDSRSFSIVHVDKRADRNVYSALKTYSSSVPNVYLAERHRCYWGRLGMVRGTFSCIKKAIQMNRSFDYAILLSGQDYPIKSVDHIKLFLSENFGSEFIESFAYDEPNRWTDHAGSYNAVNRVQFWTFWFRSRHIQIKIKRKPIYGFRFYGGSQWWCLSRACIAYLNTFISDNPSFMRYFKYAFIPDETVFQSILLNSPFRNSVVSDDLRYMDWHNPNPNYPRTLDLSDFEKLKSSTKLFARKFDPERSEELLKTLDDLCDRIAFEHQENASTFFGPNEI